MTFRDALIEYGDVCIVNDLDQEGYVYPLTATTMAFEPDPKIREQENHRRSRKANRKRKETPKVFLPQNAKRYGKRMLHKYNRRNWNPSELYHKVKQYSFGDILWDFT